MAISNNQVAMSDTAAVIFPNDSDGANVYLYNSGVESIYLGDADVTDSNGYELAEENGVALQVGPGEAVWGVMASEETGEVSYIATLNE